MIADDRRTFCDLRSVIRDRLRSYGNQPLRANSKRKADVCQNTIEISLLLLILILDVSNDDGVCRDHEA